MCNPKFWVLPFVLLISIVPLSSAMEVEYDKAGSEIPLSKWWIERTYEPENRLGIVAPIENIGLGCEDYWPAPARWRTESDAVLFIVSPSSPALYWMVSTANFYDGRGWAKTTSSREVSSFPERARTVEQVFTVTFTTSSPKVSLPVPQHRTNLTNFRVEPAVGLSFLIDEIADVYSISTEGLRNGMEVSYQATYAHETIDLARASLPENIPPEIGALYLQVPTHLPSEVREMARALKNPALGVGAQILADIAYLKNNFYYTGTRLSDAYGADASNSFADARTIGTKTVSGYLDNVDTRDYWKMYLAAGDHVGISLSVPSGADFDLYFYGPDRSPLASSARGMGASESIYRSARSSGFHYLEVRRYYGSGYYSLSSSAKYVEKDWIVDFWRRGEGSCMDFNTALAIILRLQGIPSRVNFGFQPGPERDGERLYLASGGHSEAEAYLYPYGWVRVDATPEAGALRPQEAPCQNPPASTEPTEPLPPAIVPTITPTVLELTVTPENSTRKGAVFFSVRLMTRGGAAVAGKTITVTDDLTRKTLATITTDSTGRGSASYAFSKADAVGERFITARFAGDQSYGASSDSEPFLLYAPTTLSLKLSETKIVRGSTLVFSGELTDDFNEGVPAQTIAAMLDGARVGDVQTGGVGRYENSLVIGKNVAPGTHTLQTSFEPARRGYLPSKSPVYPFEVLQEQAGVEVPENTGIGTPPENIAAPPKPVWDMTLVYAVALAGVTAAALAIAIRLFRPKKVKEEKPRIPTASAIKKMLAEFEKAKRYREGIIAAYFQLVGFLTGAGVYAVKPEETARELRAGLSGKIKNFSGDDFGEFVKVYEKAMFSEKPITKADFDHAVEKLTSALDSIKGGG